jgi:hypothetical protein
VADVLRRGAEKPCKINAVAVLRLHRGRGKRRKSGAALWRAHGTDPADVRPAFLRPRLPNFDCAPRNARRGPPSETRAIPLGSGLLGLHSVRLHCVSHHSHNRRNGRPSPLPPSGLAQTFEHVGVVFWPDPRHSIADIQVEGRWRYRNGPFQGFPRFWEAAQLAERSR